MKTLLFLFASVLLSGYCSQIGNNKNSVTDMNSVTSNLYCPETPSFTEMIKNTEGQISNDPEYDNDWYTSVIGNIEREEYNISYNEELEAYQSPNRANDIIFTYHKSGFTAKANLMNLTNNPEDTKLNEENIKNEKIDDWEIKFKIKNEELGVDDGKICAAGNKAWIENGKIRIDYTNNEEGMRQDFIIKNKPEAEGKLRLNIAASTKLKMIVGADALMFKDKDGNEKMKYSSLKCWDANGKELRAYFEKNNEELGIKNYELKAKLNSLAVEKDQKSFSIVVNDIDAVYPVTIDPLSTSANWSKTGTNYNDDFGNSVATAGDVNGDGYSDVIIGASGYSSFKGKVYVFHGSATGLSNIPDWTAESNQSGAYFGNSVSTAGDVNGDGFSDVIIGSFRYKNDTTDEGKVFVYFGSSTGLSDSADWTAEGEQYREFLGNSVSTGGDVNGDGYSDIIVGAYGYSNGQFFEGRAYVFHGSSTGLSDSADWTAESNQDTALFGYSVSTAGDVNGDGFSDVIIGAYGFNNGVFYNKGRAYVYYGSPSGLSVSEDWTAEINQSNAYFGSSVSAAGDVNGDGYSDVIIGAFGYTNGQNNEGRAYVFHGSSSGLENSPAWAVESNDENANYGSSVSTAGDINGDGYSDVIVGARYYTNGQAAEGRAYLYTGSSNGLSSSVWGIESNQQYAYYGCSVFTAGDVNGDGFSDVIVGAEGYSNNGSAFVYNGSAAGLSGSVKWAVESDNTGAQYGYSVSTAGDVNGDGYSDVIIGAPFYQNGQTDEGRVFLYLGTDSGLSVTSVWGIESNLANARFGSSISTAGDVNGDGYCDVIIGAEKLTNGQTNEGKAFVYFGTSTGLSPSIGWSMEGDQDNSGFGHSVSTAGDVNGDGYSDIIVGANFFDNGQTDEGKVFVYYGSSSGPSLTPDWTFESDQQDAYLGMSVSTAGDVNGDGFSDVIVGASEYSNGSTDEGRVFGFYGSSAGLSTASNWTAESDQAAARMGLSVSNAGDVNGDGYSDVIIGAPYFNNGSTDEGLAYVYHGSSTGLLSFSSFTVESNQTSAYMGWSVSSAGDVNGDGYSDVLVSIRNFDNGQNNEGAVNLYYGSQTGITSVNRWHIESNTANIYFGQSVSSAGDVNGDGYSDVVIGAHLFTSGNTNEGKAFAYYGNDGVSDKSNIQQYKPGTNDVLSSGGLTGTDGEVRLNAFGRSPFGRADGKIVYEYKANGIPFSGNNITNSTSYSGSGNLTDLGTDGIELFKDISGIPVDKEYKWRARVEYSLVNNPFQKFGPWKYYTNYIPEPFGCFKAQSDPLGQTLKTLSLNMFIEGFFNTGNYLMIPDTVTVSLRSSSSPYNLIESSKSIITSDGDGIFLFENAENGTPYFIEVTHRNSIGTWSKTPQQFTAAYLTYNFSDAITTAYGDNLIEVKPSPDAIYAIYSGDVNQDGTIDLADGSLIDNDAYNFVSGYVPTDVNADYVVDLADAVFADNNGFNFVSKITP